jgi:hypothetical protein
MKSKEVQSHLLNLQTRSERFDARSHNSQFVLIIRGVARYDNLGNECSNGWWMKLCKMVKRLGPWEGT